MHLPPLACWLHWLHQICQASPTIRSQYFLYLSVTQTSRSCETVESRCYSLKEAGVSPTTLDTDYRHNYMIIIVTVNMFFLFGVKTSCLMWPEVTGRFTPAHASERSLTSDLFRACSLCFRQESGVQAMMGAKRLGRGSKSKISRSKNRLEM